MFDKFLSSNARDWRQRYEGTYGIYIEGNKRLLCKLSRISLEGTPEITFVSANGADFSLVADTEGVEWEFLLPEAGAYNTSKGVVLVSRTAARQFQRGISENNTSIQLRGARGDLNRAAVNFTSLELIQSAGLQGLSPLDYYNKHNSLALSKHFYLFDHFLYVNTEPLGVSKFDKDNQLFQIKVDKSLFTQEITDVFKRNNLKLELSCRQ